MKRITLEITENQYDLLAQIAEQKEIAMSDQVRTGINLWLRNNDPEREENFRKVCRNIVL
ncbi:MAG: hypothetical protein U9Q21_03255 [Candidatus Auribacterota bacterium]|nr:hypothetical protein [Candidatus Auribacterota bacterium]